MQLQYLKKCKIAKHDIHLKITGKLRSQSLSKICHGVVQVENRGMLQALRLFDDGCNHIRVAMPAAHCSNPSEPVHVPPSLIIEQILPLPLHHVKLQPPTHDHTRIINLVSYFSYTCATEKNNNRIEHSLRDDPVQRVLTGVLYEWRIEGLRYSLRFARISSPVGPEYAEGE